MTDRLLDIFFLVFHSSLVIFNLFGWIWRKTRFANLIALMLTGASWLFLGLIVGTLGYCPFTDWHFNVLERLGHYDLPTSYVKYLTDRLTGLDVSGVMIDKVTLCAFFAALAISIILNTRDRLKRRGRRLRMSFKE